MRMEVMPFQRRIFNKWDPNRRKLQLRRFREYAEDASPPRDIRGRQAGHSWRLRHDRSHFAGRINSCRLACWKVLIANGVEAHEFNYTARAVATMRS